MTKLTLTDLVSKNKIVVYHKLHYSI